MRSRKRWAVIGVLMLATATVVATLGVASAGAQGEPIHVFVPAEGSGFVMDFDHDGRIDTGDRTGGRAPVEDPATGERIGSSLGDCVATTRIVVEQQKGIWMCTRVLRLADGHITIQGEDPAGDGASSFAVTGGTGLFSGARGEAVGVDSSDGTEFTIHLEL